MSSIKADITSKFEKAMGTFQDVSDEEGDRDYLKLFSFICELSLMLHENADDREADGSAEDRASGS